MNPFNELANAIIIQAAKDYRKALRSSGSRKSFCEWTDKAAIERFFRSEWYTVLNNLDPEILISRLQTEVA